MTSVAERISDRISARWVAGQVQKLPGDWSEIMVRGWRKRFEGTRGHEGEKRRAANTLVRETIEGLRGGSILPLTADEDAVRARAVVRSRSFQLLRHEISPSQKELLLEETGAITPDGAVERMCCERWWRRRLRKSHGRAVERAGIQAGVVRSSRQVYVSDVSVTRRRQQKSRNRSMLEEMLAVNELGDELKLSEVVDASVSNPVLRRGELMCRMAGMEWCAKAVGWGGWFLTLTAPSAYHPTRSHGRKIADNPRYEGFTPREAQAWLCKIWSRVRAAVKRADIEWFGFRVAEPHGDGTPHWHMLMFWPPEHTENILSIFRKRALAEYGNEKGARGYRFQAKKIDPKRGSAAGYIAKYVAKNIDGAHMRADDPAAGNDMFGRDPVSLAERVDAWASTWGIRQFQQIGGPGVSVWRELRRMDWEESGHIELLREAADAGNWGVFMHTMREITGAARLARLEEINTATGGLPLNRYGEPKGASIVGVEHGGEVYVTRFHTWRIEHKGGAVVQRPGPGYVRPKWVGVVHGRRVVGECGGSRCFKRAGTARAPWSPVNNCTGGADGKGGAKGRGHARAAQRVPGPILPGEEQQPYRGAGGSGGAAVGAASDKHRAGAGNGRHGRSDKENGGGSEWLIR